MGIIGQGDNGGEGSGGGGAILSPAYSIVQIQKPKLSFPAAGQSRAEEDETSMKNDEGIAYGLIAVVMFIGMVALILICFTPAMNGVIEAANDLIGDGKVGVQTAGAVEWGLGWFAAIPLIALLGIGYWSYIRALEENPSD